MDEHVTVAAGVPTIWMGVLPELKGRDTSSLRAILVRRLGGAAGALGGVPHAARPADPAGVGDDRDKPGGSVGRIKSTLVTDSDDELADLRTTVGALVLGVEHPRRRAGFDRPAAVGRRVVAASSRCGARGSQPATTTTSGRVSRSPRTAGSSTGDVATIDAHGYIRLVDRTKDLIKSGGEWISSVEIENELMAHPKMAEAAVIGVPHPKWAERPLACVVVKPGEELTKDEVIDFLAPKLAKWQLPDDVVFIDEVPKTSVGKFSKKDLRARFADYSLPG